MRSSAAAALLAASMLAACDAPPASGPIEVEARPWGGDPAPRARLQRLSALELRSPAPAFGGFSGLEISADGDRIVAISDRGLWFEARLVRKGDRLVGLAEPRLHPLIGPDGGAPAFALRDSEGLAISDPALAGPRVVSFERVPRLGRFDGTSAAERPLPGPERIEAGHPNEGMEALAVAPDGRLLAVRERPSPGEDDFSAWWIAPDGAVTRTAIPRLGRKMAVGADFTPDGRLILLTRTFSRALGFRFAVWRFRVDGDALVEGEILLDALPGDDADNAEGVAAWRDAAGRTRILVVTDDNASLMQRTLLIEFGLPGDAGASP
ncbi:MAG: esterase-like activity of phytase family protein [Paracoccaceae bacterium]